MGKVETPLHIRVVRDLLRRLNYHLGPSKAGAPAEPFDNQRLRQAEAALRAMRMLTPDAQHYLEKHIPRLARTLALVPAPQQTGTVLELGCYMQITPLLEHICGYREVRGAYYGPLG